MAAENGFDDPVIGAGGWAYAYSDVDFPFGRDIEVGDYEDLLLLVMERIERAQAAVVRVVFDTATDLAVKVVAKFCSGGEAYALFYIGPCQVRSNAGFIAQYHRPWYLSTIGRISQVQVSGEYTAR